jgi:hypothetical protein
MSNRGLASGLTPNTWYRYKPRMICVGGTDPDTSDQGNPNYQTGQFQLRPNGSILAVVQKQFFTASIGSGGPYAYELPVPARRLGSTQMNGSGMCYLSFTGSPNVNFEVTPILGESSGLDDPDRWFQALAPSAFDWGTGTLSNAATSVTVNHNLGFAFDPAYLRVNVTNNSGNAWHPMYCDTVTPTQFTLHTRNNVVTPAANVGFEWTIEAPPPSGTGGALVSPTLPFAWSRVTSLGPFGNHFFIVEYPPKR